MILIVGLGNPGEKYKNTRHNIGFMVLEEFAGKNNFPEFRFSKKITPLENKHLKGLNALISKGVFNSTEIILAKPQTFMNNSGKTVKKLIEDCKLKIENFFVVHDDIDLPLGKIKIVQKRGSAGHKGVQSIIENLGTGDFVRFRVGINPFSQNQKSKISPRTKTKFGTGQENQNDKSKFKKKKLDIFVLRKFNKDEKQVLKETIKKTIGAIEMALKDGVEKTMNQYNL